MLKLGYSNWWINLRNNIQLSKMKTLITIAMVVAGVAFSSSALAANIIMPKLEKSMKHYYPSPEIVCVKYRVNSGGHKYCRTYQYVFKLKPANKVK